MVKKGDTLIRLKNQKLVDKENQVDQIVKHLEEQKGMLEQLKQSIQSNKPVFSDEIDKKYVKSIKLMNKAINLYTVKKKMR